MRYMLSGPKAPFFKKSLAVLGLALLPVLAAADFRDGYDNYDLAAFSGGDNNWYQDFTYSAPGGDPDSARSGAIGDNQFTYIEASVYGPGTLVFWWRVDSSGCWPAYCDVLNLQLDGGVRGLIGGWRDWHEVKLWVPPGTHAVRWAYSKDSGTMLGADAGWVDRVVFYPASAEPMDVSWNYVADLPTPGRTGLASAAVDGSVYAVGGWDGSLLPYNARFDDGANFWEIRADMTTARRDLAAAVLDGKVFAVGGTGGTGALATVEVYNPGSNSWSAESSMSNARSEHVTVAANGRIYAIGGYDSAGPGFRSSLEEFDPNTTTWTIRAPMGGARAGMAAAVVNNMIYVIGGYSGGVLSAVEEYNPFTNAWTPRASMPTPRKWLAAAALNGKIYAIGGMDGSGQPLSIVEEYDPISDIWASKSPLPGPRYGHAATAVNGRIVVSGGNDGFGNLSGVLRGSLVPAVFDPRSHYTSMNGRIPEKGDIVVAPNRLDPTSPNPYVYFVVRGDPFGITGFRVYNELGQLMIERTGVALDQDGVAVVDFDGKDERGRKLGTGLYWVLFKDGGVEGKQAFMVARGEKH